MPLVFLNTCPLPCRNRLCTCLCVRNSKTVYLRFSTALLKEHISFSKRGTHVEFNNAVMTKHFIHDFLYVIFPEFICVFFRCKRKVHEWMIKTFSDLVFVPISINICVFRLGHIHSVTLLARKYILK